MESRAILNVPVKGKGEIFGNVWGKLRRKRRNRLRWNATRHSFGMRRRLIMREPDTPKSKAIGCKVNPASDSSPPHKPGPTAPDAEADASSSTSTTDVGIGVPSK
jgi:hypothetical protein